MTSGRRHEYKDKGENTKMKKLAIALCAVAALLISISASADTINYVASGWQATCTSSTYTGVEGPPRDCLNMMGVSQGSLSQGTITGTGQFVGTSAGGILTVISDVYVQDVTASSATISSTSWYALNSSMQVTTGGGGLTGCVGAPSICSATTNTPLPIASIDLYTGGVLNGVVSFIVTAASAGGLVAWQGYTLTVVPEPGTALLLGMGLLGLAVSGRRK